MLKSKEAFLDRNTGNCNTELNTKLNTEVSLARYWHRSIMANTAEYRQGMIDLLRMKLQDCNFGETMDILRDFILPTSLVEQGFTNPGDNNFWLIDERLSHHRHYLGSHTPPLPASDPGDESAINDWVWNNPHVFSDTGDEHSAISIIEMKRPIPGKSWNNTDLYPMEGALGYRTSLGTLAGMTDHDQYGDEYGGSAVPAHIYVLAEFTAELKKRCRYCNFKLTPDGTRYFSYNDSTPETQAYIEIIDCKEILSQAERRNVALLA